MLSIPEYLPKHLVDQFTFLWNQRSILQGPVTALSFSDPKPLWDYQEHSADLDPQSALRAHRQLKKVVPPFWAVALFSPVSADKLLLTYLPLKGTLGPSQWEWIKNTPHPTRLKPLPSVELIKQLQMGIS